MHLKELFALNYLDVFSLKSKTIIEFQISKFDDFMAWY
jgi:hypothetical protein